MPDIHNSDRRSFNMSRVKSHGNRTTEGSFVRILKSSKISGWRRRCSILGRPDFVFRPIRVAVFLDGCFWHQCPKKCKPAPKNNPFWTKKLGANALRDRMITRRLKESGWVVLRFWEHDLAYNTRYIARRLKGALRRASLGAY
jgi:DNA mismatch endonuclease (patch repair protein)